MVFWQDHAGRHVLQGDGGAAIVAGGAQHVAADGALVAPDAQRLGQLAQQPPAHAIATQRARLVEDGAHATGRFDPRAGHVLELDHLVVLVDGGQVRARVAPEEALAVRDGLLHGGREEGALDGRIETGRLDHLLVGAAGGQLRAQAVPGLLADIGHLVDVVRHGAPPRGEGAPRA